MSDIDERSLATSMIHVIVTAGANAASLASLVSASLPTWASVSNILSITITPYAATDGTSRGAILYGAATPIGYLAAGVEKDLPVRKGSVYIKRPAASDVACLVEVYLGPHT
jgi:hypothetical protein